MGPIRTHSLAIFLGPGHGWELLGNHIFLMMVMLIYHYVEIIWKIIVTPNFCTTDTIMKKNTI